MSYLGVDVVFVAVAAATFAVALVRHPDRAQFAVATAVTTAVLVALTVVFDGVMIGADLFRYDAGSLAGPHVWRVPMEDLAWPLAAALLVPSVRSLAARRAVRAPEVSRAG
ncbi:lycopene cyclase domain-containing protein [Cellulomonas alba]|uniref:Lycopene cyclase domain-containing protein n=1 Tax=Cellulomonas alba TaxID=3053467 RepID=A0ABT7SDA5_9CELL|nr:lycopene cyclase domain-containing protein [Cellulomonas alba]MDM7853499.1 lycopene cyclase domain-containing protein [Cellulomonas alba]